MFWARCRPQASSPVLQLAPSFVEARHHGNNQDFSLLGLDRRVCRRPSSNHRQSLWGARNMALPDWMLKTRMFHTMTGRNGGSTGIDDGFAERSTENVGAWIMGRHMFGP